MAVTGGPFASLLRLITQAGAWPLQAWPLQPNPRLGRPEPQDWPATLSSWLLLAFQVARLSRAGILRSFLRLGLSDLRPSGQVMSGQGRILLGRNRGPTRSHNPGVQPAPARPLSQSNAQPEVRAGQVRPSHATKCLNVGPSVNGTLSERDPGWSCAAAAPGCGHSPQCAQH